MGFLGLSWYVWGMLGFVLAGIFAFSAPREQGAMSTTKFIIVRWFHSLVWALLALSFCLRGLDNMALSPLADSVALAGGVVYVVYLVTTLRAAKE
jgi:hypothetical protein